MKYYTPKPAEFHIGFRYEQASPQDLNTWIKHTLHITTNIHDLLMYINIRVKYLDQSDIEELGWQFTGKTTELWFGIPKMNIQPFNLTYRSVKLGYDLNDHRLMLLGYEYENYSPENSQKTLFLGKVNNYNELEKIMTHLQIPPNY